MNEERALRLYEAITDIREDWAEDARPGEKPRRRFHRRGLAAIAACLCLFLGIGIYQAFFSGGNGTVRREHAPGENYQCYAGPVLPLTAEEENDAVTLSRELTLDLSPFPVDSSRTASQTVAYMPALLPSTSCSLTFCSTSAGEKPWSARFLISVLTMTMNMAAGTPLPETSPITMAR